MRYGILFLLLGVSLAGLAALSGGFGWGLLWPAASFVVVAIAYARRRPTMLGKHRDGTMALWAWALLGPYLLLTLALSWIERWVSREDAANEVAPGLWVGRRPRVRDLPASIDIVVDLTAELPAARGVRLREDYVGVPVLDGTAPAVEALRALLERLGDRRGIFLHCASGHGRSATVAAALLIARGVAADVEQAEAHLQRARPGIRLRAEQRQRVRALDLGPSA
ncbi:Ser/Thr and Tyr protein phosphatase (dual specificity) [Minicystis rosea]|nr:Ser/Thr and Tyr protein phosphatase (dual specificity) [Minicystis rosea]